MSKLHQHNLQSKGKRSRRARVALRAAFCVVVAVALAACVGCRDTDALKEIIYDQSSSIIDYNNPNKHYINNSQSDQESDQVSSKEVSDEDPTSDIIQNLIIYSSTPNSEGFIAKTTKFAQHPDFTGIEASESVFFYKSNRSDAVEHAVTAAEEEQQEEEEDEEETQQSEGDSNDQDATINTTAGTSQTGGTVAGNTEEDDNGGGSGGPTEVIGDYDPTNGFSPNQETGGMQSPTVAYTAFNPNDDAADHPMSSFAAFGEYAAMVQMVGGSGALVATDYETLKGFHNAGISGAGDIASGVTGDIAMGWRDSGSAAYLDVDAIIAAFQSKDPEGLANHTCAIIAPYSAEAYFGKYGDALTKLENAGIRWINLLENSCSYNIKSNVSDLGAMLKSSKVAQYGESASGDSNSAARASHYASVHDAAVKNANGGLAQTSDYYGENKVLQSNDTKDFNSYGGITVCSLLVNGWDAQAYFQGYPFDSGIAFSAMGYSSTPVSYYMQAGGVINNAAVVKTASTKGESAVTQVTWGNGIDASALVTTSIANPYTNYRNVRSLLDTGIGGSPMAGQGLGTSLMPKIIVTSNSIKQAMILSSASATSLYHPYNWITAGIINGAGTVIQGNSYWGAIGNDTRMSAQSPNNPVGSSLADSMIIVNPNGYFCDWTEGSVESFLESTWISSQFGGGYDYNQWKSDVLDFYSWAYGVNVNINTIINQ